MQHLLYSVRYSVVPINSSLSTVTLCYSIITTQNIQSLSWRYNRVPLYLYLQQMKVGTNKCQLHRVKRPVSLFGCSRIESSALTCKRFVCVNNMFWTNFIHTFQSPQTLTSLTNAVRWVKVGNVDRFFTGHCALTSSCDVFCRLNISILLTPDKKFKTPESHSVEIFPPRLHPWCDFTLTFAAVKGSNPLAFTFFAL
jgi:hypothetical protein